MSEELKEAALNLQRALELIAQHLVNQPIKDSDSERAGFYWPLLISDDSRDSDDSEEPHAGKYLDGPICYQRAVKPGTTYKEFYDELGIHPNSRLLYDVHFKLQAATVLDAIHTEVAEILLEMSRESDSPDAQATLTKSIAMSLADELAKDLKRAPEVRNHDEKLFRKLHAAQLVVIDLAKKAFEIFLERKGEAPKNRTELANFMAELKKEGPPFTDLPNHNAIKRYIKNLYLPYLNGFDLSDFLDRTIEAYSKIPRQHHGYRESL